MREFYELGILEDVKAVGIKDARDEIKVEDCPVVDINGSPILTNSG